MRWCRSKQQNRDSLDQEGLAIWARCKMTPIPVSSPRRLYLTRGPTSWQVERSLEQFAAETSMAAAARRRRGAQ